MLTGNDLAELASIEKLPSPTEIAAFKEDTMFNELLKRFHNDAESLEWHVHEYAQKLLKENKVDLAWQLLLQL